MSDERLAEQRAAVLAARERLGEDLERLDEELRAQVGGRVQQIVWKLLGVGVGFGAAFAVRQGATAAWRAAKRAEPPEDPTDPATPWRDALLWTVVTAVGVAVAQLVAQRGADAGWRRATGGPPPGRA